MRLPIGRDGWYLFDGADETGSLTARFRGQEKAAREWLERFRKDFTVLSAIRNQLARDGAGTMLNDADVLQKTAALLAAGKWKARQEHTGGGGGGGSSGGGESKGGGAMERVPAGPAFPLEYRHRDSGPSHG